MNATQYPSLGSHAFLHGLPEQHVARLAAHCQAVEMPARHRLFEEGRTANRFWLIEAGQVALDAQVAGRGRVKIEMLGRGDVVGLSWLFPPYQWGFGAITTQRLQALEFDAAAIRAECSQDPEFGQEITARFLRVAARRLQATRTRLIDVIAHPELLP